MTDNGKQKILLFLGSDIVAHMIMNQVVPMLCAIDYEPVLFFPKHRVSKTATSSAVKTLGFYERTLLNDTIYPFLEKDGSPHQTILTPRQLAEGHDLHMEEVEDVNDPAFVKRIAGMDNVAGAISIRCFQIFKEPIINLLNVISHIRVNDGTKDKGLFVNLHPGILPTYRGVLSTARTMAATLNGTNGKSFGCTLHVIDPGIDTGAILWKKTREIDLSKSVFATNIDMVELGSQAIEGIFTELRKGNTLDPTPQELISAKHMYYTYPENSLVSEWKKAGLVFVKAEEAKNTYIKYFSKPGTPHATRMNDALDASITISKQQKRLANGNNLQGGIGIEPRRKRRNDGPKLAFTG